MSEYTVFNELPFEIIGMFIEYLPIDIELFKLRLINNNIKSHIDKYIDYKYIINDLNTIKYQNKYILYIMITFTHLTRNYKRYLTHKKSSDNAKLICDISLGKNRSKKIIYLIDGTKILENNYKDFKLDGLVKCYHDNGILSKICTYRNGKLNGAGRYYKNNGELSKVTNYRNGKYNYEQIEYMSNGYTTTIHQYKEGKKHGKTLAYYDNFLGLRIEYDNGLRNGVHRKYRKGGILEESYNYFKGRKHGICRKWSDKNILIHNLNYYRGEYDKTNIYYYDNGNRHIVEKYNRSYIEHRTIYHSNGKIHKESKYFTKDEMREYSHDGYLDKILHDDNNKLGQISSRDNFYPDLSYCKYHCELDKNGKIIKKLTLDMNFPFKYIIT